MHENFEIWLSASHVCFSMPNGEDVVKRVKDKTLKIFCTPLSCNKVWHISL